MDKFETLHQYFGFSAFREGQEYIIDEILKGKDVIGIMPTGAGKSICFQLPALMMEGITLVVSPLISLMKDQVMALKQEGVKGAYINSSLTAAQSYKAVDNMRCGLYKIVYVAPERLLNEDFLAAIANLKIDILAIDEAHCISQWGQDFRPSYTQIPQFIKSLPNRPVIAAFTATATEKVAEDIIEQ
ncbi:MAG: DEAD/DEAH box helicase, partial [Oscillospiraceae bacterium]